MPSSIAADNPEDKRWTAGEMRSSAGDVGSRALKSLQHFGLELRPLRGKGLGLVALRDFSKGEMVLSDTALVKVGVSLPSTASSWTRQQAVSVLLQMARMGRENRTSLLQLSARQDSKQPLVLRIVSNCLTQGWLFDGIVTKNGDVFLYFLKGEGMVQRWNLATVQPLS